MNKQQNKYIKIRKSKFRNVIIVYLMFVLTGLVAKVSFLCVKLYITPDLNDIVFLELWSLYILICTAILVKSIFNKKRKLKKVSLK